MTDLEFQNGDQVFHSDAKVHGNHEVAPSISFSGSTLDWYKLTETSRHVLSQAISGSIQEQLNEMQKLNPNEKRIHDLEQFTINISKINRDPKNFKSKEKMIGIIKSFSNLNFDEQGA
jgi:hypothetical protein